jgi:low affinity Fe/Cu permease
MAQDAAERNPIRPFHFSTFARRLASLSGRPAAFVAAAGAIVLWAASGPLFGFSDTWQLVVNTSTTIVTFLMVFLIQSTQNRDTAAIQLKLDELIRATQGAHNALIDLEEIDDDQLAKYLMTYQRLARRSRERMEKGEIDTDSPEIKALSGK